MAPNKRPGEAKKLIYMQVTLFRFKALKTDILVSLNVEVDQNGTGEEKLEDKSEEYVTGLMN